MPDLSAALTQLIEAATVQIHAPRNIPAPRNGAEGAGGANGVDGAQSKGSNGAQSKGSNGAQSKGAAAKVSTRLLGTGFFVAPGWILTCAHVVLPQPAQAQAQAQLQGGRFGVTGAVVGASTPAEARLEQTLWPAGKAGKIPFEQDLALLRLEDEDLAGRHECVWIADWAGSPLGDERLVLGYHPGESGDARMRQVLARINVADGGERRFEPMAQFKSGLSGSSVAAPEAGAVVGVMKARQEGYGGAAIDITAMRGFRELYADVAAAHDIWHHERRDRPGSWVALQEEAARAAGRSGAPDLWSPTDRSTALYHLARLRRDLPKGTESEKPGEIDVLVRQAKRRRWLSNSHPAPQSWRDGHGELYDGARPLEAEVFLRYLRRVTEYAESTGLDTGELAHWLDEREEQLPGRRRPVPLPRPEPAPDHGHMGGGSGPTGHAHPGPEVQAVHVRPPETAVEPVAYPHPGSERSIVVLELEEVLGEQERRFYWTVRIDHADDDDAPLDDNEAGPGALYRDLVHEVGGALTRAFELADLGGSPAPLEVALQHDHFDEPVHQWQLNNTVPLHQDLAKEPLGVHRPVVVRSLMRLRELDPERSDRRGSRWRDLHAAERISAVRLPPAGKPLGRAAERIAPGEVPTLCRSAGDPVGAEALGAVIDQDHGIALWHGVGHERSPCSDACTALHEQLDDICGSCRTADELPHAVWQLRRDIAHGAGPNPAAALALLYDRPVDDAPVPLDSPS
ncbi:VMAP-C domain-containing protein [Streptomyces cavernicola]|uniref:Trypsin-like peptidase domain-containing protein n=1 Tax=Streptomyces cavernicola TaxID=3043613 RepID=A0ABT6S8Z5_9ACTN|nr:trypsin-like peptidase domain-containing protein [Streptomyces sp. B-S-A6]MDI3404570.1 trypsin-like peptidase domain-containing protein [Streptomyces sp. B-S-A6]